MGEWPLLIPEEWSSGDDQVRSPVPRAEGAATRGFSGLSRLVTPVDPVRSVCGCSPRELGALEWRLTWSSALGPNPIGQPPGMGEWSLPIPD
jgi:hypothetical protein